MFVQVFCSSVCLIENVLEYSITEPNSFLFYAVPTVVFAQRKISSVTVSLCGFLCKTAGYF